MLLFLCEEVWTKNIDIFCSSSSPSTYSSYHHWLMGVWPQTTAKELLTGPKLYSPPFLVCVQWTRTKRVYLNRYCFRLSCRPPLGWRRRIGQSVRVLRDPRGKHYRPPLPIQFDDNTKQWRWGDFSWDSQSALGRDLYWQAHCLTTRLEWTANTTLRLTLIYEGNDKTFRHKSQLWLSR